ncbi:MAG: MFS transporter [Gemmataceae bacterium]|nr:MFS transporter [Gemmataceae bacterium]
MTPSGGQAGDDGAPRERLLRVLSGATFLVFFQAFMVAPLLPRFARAFGVTPQEVGLTVPAYMVPYGVATLFYGLLSDRRRIMLASLLAFGVLTALTATAQSAAQLILWRLLTGLGLVALALLLPYRRLLGGLRPGPLRLSGRRCPGMRPSSARHVG